MAGQVDFEEKLDDLINAHLVGGGKLADVMNALDFKLMALKEGEEGAGDDE